MRLLCSCRRQTGRRNSSGGVAEIFWRGTTLYVDGFDSAGTKNDWTLTESQLGKGGVCAVALVLCFKGLNPEQIQRRTYFSCIHLRDFRERGDMLALSGCCETSSFLLLIDLCGSVKAAVGCG